MGHLSSPVTGETKRLPGTGVQLLLYLWPMMYAVTYDRIHHLLDIRYDVTSRATVIGDVSPAVALPAHNQHTAVFTEP